MVCGRRDVKEGRSVPSRRNSCFKRIEVRVCFIREANKSSGWLQQREGGRKGGKMELEVLRNWNHPKTYTGGDVSLTTLSMNA